MSKIIIQDELSLNTIALFRAAHSENEELITRLLRELKDLLRKSRMGLYLYQALEHLRKEMQQVKDLTETDKQSIRSVLTSVKNSQGGESDFYQLALATQRCSLDLRKRRALQTHTTPLGPDPMKPSPFQAMVDRIRREKFTDVTTRLHIPSRPEIRNTV